VSEKTAVFSDIHGQFDIVYPLLQKLGIDVEKRLLPEDLNLVVAGDLVHRGHQSYEVVLFFDEMTQKYPEKVHVLAGNHESQYLGFPDFIEERVDLPTEKLLQKMYREGRLKAAHGFVSREYGNVIVTHGGVTEPFLESLKLSENSKQDVKQVAERINEMFLNEEEKHKVMKAGVMFGDFRLAPVGPFWAHPYIELAVSWAPFGKKTLPFTQVHGHASVLMDREKRPRLPDRLEGRVEKGTRHAYIKMQEDIQNGKPVERYIIQIDPGYDFRNKRPYSGLKPLVLENS